MANNKITTDQTIDKRKASLRGYHFYLPHSVISEDALKDLIYCVHEYSGYVQALYDRADPKDITNINLNKNTFKALRSIPAEY
jgi:hypothetical protein